MAQLQPTVALAPAREPDTAAIGGLSPQRERLVKQLILERLGDSLEVAELARACELDAGAMTRLLDRLEAKGLCRRVRSLEDRRVVNIELTEEGRAAAKEVPHVLSRVQNEHLAGFTNEEWEQLKGYLRRILDNAQALAARGEKND